jgi:hypothetical protein
LSGSSSGFDAITTLAVLPTGSSTIYAGTGNNQRHQLEAPTSGIPARYPTMVRGDPKIIGTIYVTLPGFSGFNGDTKGHVFKCTTASVACVDISSNLPNIPANDIVLDPALSNIYYCRFVEQGEMALYIYVQMFCIGRERRTRSRGVEPAGSCPTLVNIILSAASFY